MILLPSSRKPQQFPLDLGHADTYTRADFYASACNQDALAWVEKWPAWPAPLLIVHGPPASGKTHLAHIWRDKAQAQILSFQDEIKAKALVIDDAQRFIGSAADEENLLHIYNMMQERGGHILMTAQTPPAAWTFSLPDLKSRLLAAPAVALHSPDDVLMSVVLAKMFSDRQIFVPQDVISFLLARMERSFLNARHWAEKMDSKALAEKRPITLSLVREMMQEEERELPFASDDGRG